MRSLPRFSVENPVLVGVLMFAILIGGLYASQSLVRDIFPESQPNRINVMTPYPGATPAEVEKGVSIRLEEAIKDVDDIERIESHISEGLSSITVKLESDVEDPDQIVNDIKAAIDAIPRDELPEEAEETWVAKFEPRLPVISVAINGDVDEATLKDIGREVRDDLALLLPGTTVELSGIRKAELTVEVEPEKLIEYGLSLAEVASVIRQSNLDLPGGQVKTPKENVAVRTLGETDEADRIATTILRGGPTGETVRVRDVGRVIDGFEDAEVQGRFNGERAVNVTVFKTGDQDAIDIARTVRAYVAGKRDQPFEQDWHGRLRALLGSQTKEQRVYKAARNDPLDPRVEAITHSNLARFIEGRLDLLYRNGFWGLVLVFGSLLVFMNWRIALWVLMGLILSISGAMMFMNALDETLNLISMFGLIIVLGLIVDDAIVVAENVYSHVENGEPPKLAAIKGTEEVTWPVLIAVFTTIGAFLPLMFVEGRMGDFMGVLPIVVICALTVSLIEALSILPSHLAEWLKPIKRDAERTGSSHRLARGMAPIRRRQQAWVHRVLGGGYERVLRLAVGYRYVTVSVVVACLLICLGLIESGRVPFVYIQKVDAEMLTINVDLPVGASIERTEEVMKQVEQAADIEEVRSVYTLVGLQADFRNEGEITKRERSHLGQAIVELATVEGRDRTSEAIIADLREGTKEITGINSMRFEPLQSGPGGKELEIEVTGERMGDIRQAADRLKKSLAGFDGVYDIADDFEEGRQEIKIELLDSARPLGLTTRMLATEVRGAFYGLEARTLQRDREDVDIRVRFPEGRRKRIRDLESMRIATPAGETVPLCEVAEVRQGRGFASIRRVDQQLAVTVSADVNQGQANAEHIIEDLQPLVADLETERPGLQIEFAGNKRETNLTLRSLARDFAAAVLIIYVMLAGLFRSYTQPFIVLTAIPLGVTGSVIGHFVMGYPITVLSCAGMVALTGIVVNDSLILVDFINKASASGMSKLEAVIAGSKRRFRPIVLTSLTTILSLSPLMAEQSFQARFLIPMAVSISFGLALATGLTLLVVPSIYLIIEDGHAMGDRLWRGTRTDQVPPPEPAST